MMGNGHGLLGLATFSLLYFSVAAKVSCQMIHYKVLCLCWPTFVQDVLPLLSLLSEYLSFHPHSMCPLTPNAALVVDIEDAGKVVNHIYRSCTAISSMQKQTRKFSGLAIETPIRGTPVSLDSSDQVSGGSALFASSE